MFKEKILKKAEEIKEELISIRRDIHAHPEIGLQEKRTSALVAEKLKKLGIEVKTNVGITGVVGLLKGKYPGKTILLRADMDCLEMTELNNIEYKSKYPGLMHACGHDAHTTWLLGAAMILSEFKDELHGNVKFLFQPAEESQGGANRMINEGVLENPKVNAAIGAHVWPIVESGKIGIKYGSMMAAPDKFTLTIYGKGGHGAEPHNCIDPISIGCQVYMSLQTIVSRKINPIKPAVISITMFNAGSAHNVIPDRVEMVGTVRTLTNELREKIPKMMESIIKGITEANGGSYEFEYIPYYPPVINNDEITDVVKHAGEEILGKDNVVELKNPTMGGEDFSYFQQKVPGTFFVVGTYNEDKKITKPLHSPYFNIDEDILSKASAVLAECALLYLNK
ncbi:M20 metallopeptidase family protein [Caminicella sporogenes]|uniref:M20 metallopeptidase family protein n=1 Tax=Caminicella sporogenes TaxID=166485 RepID=UPI0025406E58|nr:amidohydrolase [Caminicella sporogenes]WIF96097.1 amidohydrolase [Caminicella sporogenes]